MSGDSIKGDIAASFGAQTTCFIRLKNCSKLFTFELQAPLNFWSKGHLVHRAILSRQEIRVSMNHIQVKKQVRLICQTTQAFTVSELFSENLDCLFAALQCKKLVCSERDKENLLRRRGR